MFKFLFGIFKLIVFFFSKGIIFILVKLVWCLLLVLKGEICIK